MKKKSSLIASFFIIVIIIFFTVTGYILGRSAGQSMEKQTKNPVSLSSDILYLTPPVTGITANVDKVGKDAIYISLPLTPVNMPARTIRYKVLITPATQILKTFGIPYIFKSVTPATPPPLDIASLKPGITVNISTKSDLRTLTSGEFEAERILYSPVNAITGKITKIEKKKLTVRGYPVTLMTTSARPQVKDYAVSLLPDTEITVLPSLPNSNPTALDPGRFKLGMQLTVYTDTDVTGTREFTALLINPTL